MPEWNLLSASQERDIFNTETTHVQAKFAQRYKISRENFENAARMNEAKGLGPRL